MEDMRTAKYNAAIETHQRCDSISMALITGMLAISGFSVSLYNSMSPSPYASYIYIASGFVVFILYLMYRKSSNDARRARNVARALESNGSDGISYVLYNLAYGKDEAEKERLRTDYESKKPPLISLSIFRLVNYLALLLIAFLIAAFCVAN